jgi:hypothetical protein
VDHELFINGPQHLFKRRKCDPKKLFYAKKGLWHRSAIKNPINSVSKKIPGNLENDFRYFFLNKGLEQINLSEKSNNRNYKRKNAPIHKIIVKVVTILKFQLKWSKVTFEKNNFVFLDP